jgi:hypothetical protein
MSRDSAKAHLDRQPDDPQAGPWVDENDIKASLDVVYDDLVPRAGGMPLGWLSDVQAPADTPEWQLLTTTGVGLWEPMPSGWIVNQAIAPLQAQIGDAHAVATHTDLVGYIGEVEERLSAVEGTQEVAPAAFTLDVDKYVPAGGATYLRVTATQVTGPTTVTMVLATTPGVEGEVYPDIADITGGHAVWADFGGALGRVQTTGNVNVYGSALKEWIRKGAILTVHRDDTDPAHPNLVVDRIVVPSEVGSSLDTRYIQIADLKTMVAGATDWAAFQAAVAAL